MIFDVVAGNPPFQSLQNTSGRRGGGNAVWDKFVAKAFKEWSKPKGYVALIHPSGWRRGDGQFNDVSRLITSKKVEYLKLNGVDKGKKVFDVLFGFDWYIAENSDSAGETVVIDDKDNKLSIKLSDYKAIPNYDIDYITILFAHHKSDMINVMASASLYDHRKAWISKTQSDVYKHPVVYTITADKINLIYSSKNHGHFGVPKLIWSNGMATRMILDECGEYGMCEFAYAIVDTIDNLRLIKKAMESERFLRVMAACNYAGGKYDKKTIALLRKDFWREFV